MFTGLFIQIQHPQIGINCTANQPVIPTNDLSKTSLLKLTVLNEIKRNGSQKKKNSNNKNLFRFRVEPQTWMNENHQLFL